MFQSGTLSRYVAVEFVEWRRVGSVTVGNGPVCAGVSLLWCRFVVATVWCPRLGSLFLFFLFRRYLAFVGFRPFLHCDLFVVVAGVACRGIAVCFR